MKENRILITLERRIIYRAHIIEGDKYLFGGSSRIKYNGICRANKLK